MPDELCLHVPADLARELEEVGIEEIETVRSLDWLAHSATVAVTVVGAAADVTTVLLARDAITRFVQRVVSWASHRATKGENKLILIFESRDLEGRKGAVKVNIEGCHPVAGDDVARLVSFVVSAFADRPDKST